MIINRKTVHVAGIAWLVYSRNERSTTYGGRSFFAGRYRPGPAWRILENDRCTRAAYPTSMALSDAVRRIVGESAREPWQCSSCRDIRNDADASECRACGKAPDSMIDAAEFWAAAFEARRAATASLPRS